MNRTPEEVAKAHALEVFRAWKAYPLPDLNSDGQFELDWLHREFVAFQAGLERNAPAPHAIAGLGRITNKDDGYLTLQFKDEAAAQAFMDAYTPSVDVRDMPPIRNNKPDACQENCPTCGYPWMEHEFGVPAPFCPGEPVRCQVPVTTYLAPDGVTHWPAYSHEQRQAYSAAMVAQAKAMLERVAAAAPVAQQPHGWLTGETTYHRQGDLQNLTSNYAWAKELVDESNAAERALDSSWEDEVPVPLYTAAQAPAPDIRDAALEEAAKICDAQSGSCSNYAGFCAGTIRALKSTQENKQ